MNCFENGKRRKRSDGKALFFLTILLVCVTEEENLGWFGLGFGPTVFSSNKIFHQPKQQTTS
jgi:hypothetical protein